ncbi:hypothetical protein EDC30_101423 [Paucimonas lemoignei]|uniref:3-oxoacyl-(Acyl-carrier-protein) synthase n=1 Tax=Paucimonas lemoignei TaxID=29443 RepID=A0A4R3I166_PAULE|nr:hypothetical protein [Paucimonas lemoignei]TCS39467.1 hypothetical protein EDC30_101423 [Paucimonas lemoignei]
MMSASTSSRPVLLRLVKWILIPLGLVISIWLGVILWWQSSKRQISLEDVLIYLVAMPLAAIGIFAAIQWRRARQIKKDQSAPTTAKPANTAPNAANITESTVPSGLPVIAGWGITCAGPGIHDFHSALLEKKLRPQPDNGLLNDYGYPIHAGRVRDIDTSVVESGLERIIANNPGLSPAYNDSGRDGFLRALALLHHLTDQLNMDWPLMVESAETNDSRHGLATLRGTEPVDRQAHKRLRLQIKFIVPADFTPAEQQLALAYLLQQTSSLPVDSGSMHVQMVAATDEPAALLLAERFRTEYLHAAESQALLLLACDSTLCQVITERWQVESRLFASDTPQGLMPGEAAFAILCVNDKARSLALTSPSCTLQPVILGRRDEPADGARKAGHAMLDTVVKGALAAAGVSTEECVAIACDADHRSSRVLECIGTMLANTPHLDAIEDRLAINEMCGHTGAASNAGSCIAGIVHVAETGRPVLLFNVSHAYERAAAVLLPSADLAQASRHA